MPWSYYPRNGPKRWFCLFSLLVWLSIPSAGGLVLSEDALCTALPGSADMYPGLTWETDGPLCTVDQDSGSASILYDMYDGPEKKNYIGSIKVSLTWYGEDVISGQEFMQNPDAYRESARNFWAEYGTLEDIGDIEGGLLLTSDENTRWWSACTVFFWQAPGLYGDVRVDGNGNLEKLGIDRDSYVRTEAVRLAELIGSRLPGEAVHQAEDAVPFTCPVGGDAPLPIDPHILSHGLCRGACGYDCPVGCTKMPDLTLYFTTGEGEYYSCTYPNVTVCASHAGCREHDACYDRCVAEAGETSLLGDCHLACNDNCTDVYGNWTCAGWIAGWPPYDMNLTYSDPPVADGPLQNLVLDELRDYQIPSSSSG